MDGQCSKSAYLERLLSALDGGTAAVHLEWDGRITEAPQKMQQRRRNSMCVILRGHITREAICGIKNLASMRPEPV
jgi:hypothetical protein